MAHAHFVKVIKIGDKRFAFYEHCRSSTNLKDSLNTGIGEAEVESLWLFKTKKEATETAEYWNNNWEQEHKLLDWGDL